MSLDLRAGALLLLVSFGLVSASACSDDPVDAQPTCDGGTCTTDDGGAGDASPKGKPPAFGGAVAVAPINATSLLVTWDDAVDDRTPSDKITYSVWVAPSADALDFTKPPNGTTAPGASSFVIGALAPQTKYFVAVHANDEDGLSDRNTKSVSATTADDKAAPTFAGVKTATPRESASVDLTWDAATDDLSPAGAISYDVYFAKLPAIPDPATTTRALVTRPGALGVTLPGLADPTATYSFLVVARDAAGNASTATVRAASRPGADTVPPTFAGCTSATATSAGTATVSWGAAHDDSTPAAELSYDVFASTTRGAWDFTKPAATAKGASSTTVAQLSPGTTWYFVCRARDASGNSDKNTADTSAATNADASPPVFAGLSNSTFDGVMRTVTFTWAAATDDQTPAAQIVYDVYEAATAGGQQFTKAPRASSAPGATTITIDDLTPDTTLHWVVRARDLGGNHDANTVEATGTTNVSFARQVQPVFTTNCAVVGCHVPGDPMSGLVLAQGFAYDAIVNQTTQEYPSTKRILPGDPANSFLYLKITMNPPPFGYQMPAPSTGTVLTTADKEIIRRWIAQLAPNN